MSRRTPILYIAPWVDYGGTDKGTIDWFRWLDRDRFAPSLVTTQPSPNRRLGEIHRYAEEVWPLPEVMDGAGFAAFIANFVISRDIRLVHVMNARLGYDLLPDLRVLPSPPRIVVQLHVEEPDRSGYVRYVTTRYGNLVDAFSVTSRHLAEAVHGYGVARDRIEVIGTGVDAEEEYSPERVRPRPGLSRDRVKILYAGRLAAQKDPLLMVDAIAELASRREDFEVHVVGEGPLEPELRARIAGKGLGARVLLHPPGDLAPWYAACDLLLMASAFEGIPYVIYEAMAMGLAVVAPDLAGNRELMGQGGGVLISPREDPRAYAGELERLIGDRDERARLGAEGRELVRERHTLRAMADAHGELYRRLLSRGDAHANAHAGATPAPSSTPAPAQPHAPIRLASRPSRGAPRVSVIVPCFNHGRWLLELLASLRAQTYPDLEIVIVDDGSSEQETRAILDELERADDLKLLRMGSNRGPSAARNRALEVAGGRYILPVDADNILLPGAIEKLVGQLQGAGEQIGYVYQNLQFFGNREDYFEAPAFNVQQLTERNYIDTSALIDREVFDRGLRYPADLVHGHEDWDFFLTLAERGVHGEPATAKTLLYRRHGFTRSDSVEFAATSFAASLPARHPDLFERRPELRARWAPALSVVALTPIERDGEPARRLLTRLRAQSRRDIELICCGAVEPAAAPAPSIRWLPLRVARQPAGVLVEGLRRARGRAVLVTAGTGADVLVHRGAAELLLAILDDAPDRACAFVDADGAGGFPFRLLERIPEDRAPHGVAWTLDGDSESTWPATVAGDDPVGSLALGLRAAGRRLEWRRLAADRTACRPQAANVEVPLLRPPLPPAERLERKSRFAGTSGSDPVPVRRWRGMPAWMPVSSHPLVRHRQPGRPQRIVTNGLDPPDGFVQEWVLGSLSAHSLPGTARLVTAAGPRYRVMPAGDQPDAEAMRGTLGYLERVPFPLLDPLWRCRAGDGDREVLVRGEDDPLFEHVERLEVLGFIESLPPRPRRGRSRIGGWARGLVRSLDRDARRHRYGVAAVAPGECAWELGAMLESDPGEGIPVWIDEHDRLWTPSHTPVAALPGAGAALRWAAAPLGWSGFGRRPERARAVARRALVAAATLARLPGEQVGSRASAAARPDTAPSGWLWPGPGGDRIALHAALHPVTGDQLITRDPAEASELGYARPVMLGYALAAAPVTGSLERPRISIPWASRFGESIRWGIGST